MRFFISDIDYLKTHEVSRYTRIMECIYVAKKLQLSLFFEEFALILFFSAYATLYVLSNFNVNVQYVSIKLSSCFAAYNCQTFF